MSKNVTSRIYTLLWAKWLKMPGLGVGGQPNLGNACILGLSGQATPPLMAVFFAKNAHHFTKMRPSEELGTLYIYRRCHSHIFLFFLLQMF